MNTFEIACEAIFAKFAERRNLRAAKRCVRELVRAIGPGFHPDTQFGDYVQGDGNALFEPDVADRFDTDFEQVLTILEAAGVDPCEVGLPIQRRLLEGN